MISFKAFFPFCFFLRVLCTLLQFFVCVLTSQDCYDDEKMDAGREQLCQLCWDGQSEELLALLKAKPETLLIINQANKKGMTASQKH